jgi:hypothetical protein
LPDTATLLSVTLPLSMSIPPPCAVTLGVVEATLPPAMVRFCNFTVRFVPPMISKMRSVQPEPPEIIVFGSVLPSMVSVLFVAV